MNIEFLGILLLSFCNLGLGTIVYWKNPRRTANRWFGLFSLSVTAWSIGIAFLYYRVEDERFALLAGRLVFAAASFIPYFFLGFSKSFPSQHRSPSNTLLTLLGITSTGFALLSFSPWVVSSFRYAEASIKPVYGPLHQVFAAYFFLCLGFSLFVLARKLKRSSGLERLQLRYLFLGLLIACVGGTTTNLIIPLVLGTSVFGGYGPLFVLVLIAFSTHALIRYRLMDIKVVIRKGVVYVCAIAVTASVFMGLSALWSSATAYGLENIPLGAAVAMAVMVAILFQPLKNWIQDSLNRYLYRQTYDYQRIIRVASRQLSTILDLHFLLSYITDIIAKTLKVELVAVYMRDESHQAFTRKVFIRAAEREEGPTGHIVSTSSPLAAFLERERRPLIHHEGPKDSKHSLINPAIQELQILGGTLAFPFFQDNWVSGFLVVGSKLSGDPFFSEDFDLLSTLVSQAAIAIKNAQLYRQVILVNEYIESILATMESGVIAVDSDSTVTLFNSAAERMTRLDAQDITGNVAEHLPASLAAPLQATLTDGRSRPQVETIIQHANGHLTPVICSTSPLHDRSRTILGAVAVFSDLTRLRELEGEKRRAERLASIGALASGIAHEIKNPLVAIKTFAELLPERFTDEDFQGDFSRVVIREIERIDDLVARLRGLATSPAQPLVPLELRSPIEETLALLRAQLEQAR
ncbi:MAG: histidine kinase N-terminal 7TM domain-containing protein, partial [Thermoplasmata archaeon]